MKRLAICLAILVWVFSGTDAALAHGPTVSVSYGRVVPEVIVIRVGSTIHFKNGNRSSGKCTIVADDGSFESPTLGRAGDWHHTFETAGEFTYSVREHSGTKGRVIVAEE